MRTGTVSYKLEDLKKRVIIPIGFVGENDFTRVIFDAEEIYKKFPNASVSMKVQPPKGGIYPAAVTRDGNAVTWQVKEADVANRGGGELQLTFTDGETKIKTYIARTDVKRSLAGNGPAPDPVQDWVDNAEEVLDDLAAMDNIAKTALEGDIGKALSPKTVENGVVTEWQFVEPGAGTDDYADLDNKPSIAGVTLSGNKTLKDLGIASDDDLDNLADEVSDVKTAIHGLNDVCIKNTGVRIQSSNKAQYFSDCDNAPNNSIYEIASSAQMAHSPMGYYMSSASDTYDGTVRSVMGYPDGTLYTFNVANTKQQIFITNRNGAGGTQGSTQILFFRVKAGSSYPWTDWTMCSNVVSPSASNFAIRKVFIAPYLDGEGHPTATDTGIPNPQYIADDPFIFNDFDNAPNNSIYQIDLDCDSSVMAHNPAPGKSSVLMTINFGYKTKHAEIQLCIGLKATNGNSFFFWRYGYNAAGGVYIFTPWSQVNDVIVPNVTSSDNGKVLRVVNGAWEAVSLPSASGVSF